MEPRCIRLYSNSYTTNAILDMVTAAVAQVRGSDSIFFLPFNIVFDMGINTR